VPVVRTKHKSKSEETVTKTARSPRLPLEQAKDQTVQLERSDRVRSQKEKK
jgi:hypothetical protein